MFLLKIESADGTARFGKNYPILDLQNFRVEKKIGDRQNYRGEFASALIFLNGETLFEKTRLTRFMKQYVNMKLILTSPENGFDCKIIKIIYTGKN